MEHAQDELLQRSKVGGSGPGTWLTLLPPEFPAGALLRRVAMHGDVKWRGERVFVSEVLAHEPLGLLQTRDRYWAAYYGPVLLGWLDDRKLHLVAARSCKSRPVDLCAYLQTTIPPSLRRRLVQRGPIHHEPPDCGTLRTSLQISTDFQDIYAKVEDP